MKKGVETKKRKELIGSVRPTELADFTEQDMWELYAQFMEGPEYPQELYGAKIGNIPQFCDYLKLIITLYLTFNCVIR
jgi:hypothetical protein